jgi:hypothetical protein
LAKLPQSLLLLIECTSMFIIGPSHDSKFFTLFPIFLNFVHRAQLGFLLGLHNFAFLKNPFVLVMILLSIGLVGPLFLSQFDVHAQFWFT